MKRELCGNDIFHNVTRQEYLKIIEMYALEISELWHLFMKRIDELDNLCSKGRISEERKTGLISETFNTIRNDLGRLLIEQFYNTGDEHLFDTAMMIDENVLLEDYSAIDLDMIKRISEPEKGEDDLLHVFYRGIFFTLKNLRAPHHFKIIVRDEDEVKKVNRKLNRGRQVLKMDEFSLGKKYYEGLCYRTHYGH